MPKRSSTARSKAKTPKREGTPHDFAVIARRVVEQAIGEKLDGSPLDEPSAGKHPAAVALGKLGGAKGRPARAANLSARRRRDIAKKAAQGPRVLPARTGNRDVPPSEGIRLNGSHRRTSACLRWDIRGIANSSGECLQYDNRRGLREGLPAPAPEESATAEQNHDQHDDQECGGIHWKSPKRAGSPMRRPRLSTACWKMCGAPWSRAYARAD